MIFPERRRLLKRWDRSIVSAPAFEVAHGAGPSRSEAPVRIDLGSAATPGRLVLPDNPGMSETPAGACDFDLVVIG
ncbi:MAG: hypothetical protein U0572_16185, partial [Phycisphaerales bacterium]